MGQVAILIHRSASCGPIAFPALGWYAMAEKERVSELTQVGQECWLCVF